MLQQRDGRQALVGVGEWGRRSGVSINSCIGGYWGLNCMLGLFLNDPGFAAPPLL